jgi:hypothetical protein
VTSPLVLVKRIELWSVPSGIEASRLVRVTCEPLVIDQLGYLWLATGERDDKGHLLYRYSDPRVRKED